MSVKIFGGIDNGTSGSISFLNSETNKLDFYFTPIVRCLNYTKTKQFLNRIDGKKLREIFNAYPFENLIVYIERPMVNPMRWKASMSAIRAMEATLIILEDLSISYNWIDSKAWQKALLPSGLKGDELKVASKEVAIRMFPHLANIKGLKDGDGALIAEYARRLYK